jgi:hypothetical protein
MLRIEGQSAQRTPYSLSLAAGQYRIELALEHHERHVETARVDLKPGERQTVEFVLEKVEDRQSRSVRRR